MVYRSEVHRKIEPVLEQLVLATSAVYKPAQLRTLEDAVEIITGKRLSALSTRDWHVLQIELAKARIEDTEEKMTNEKVARMLGISVQGMLSRIRRARQNEIHGPL
jgi:hypothetical protein